MKEIEFIFAYHSSSQSFCLLFCRCSLELWYVVSCCCWVTFCVVLCLHNSIICFLLLMKIESTIAEPTSPSVYIIGLDVLKFLQHGMLIIFLFVVFWFLMGCTLTSFVMIFYFYFLGFYSRQCLFNCRTGVNTTKVLKNNS